MIKLVLAFYALPKDVKNMVQKFIIDAEGIIII